MDQIARVIQILDGGVAVVEASRKDACDMCPNKSESGCSGCGSIASIFATGKTMTAMAVNDAGAKVGDIVVLESSSALILGYAAAVFIAPIAVGLALYIFFLNTVQSEKWALAASAAGFAAVFAAIYFILERRAKRKPGIRISAIIKRADDIVNN